MHVSTKIRSQFVHPLALRWICSRSLVVQSQTKSSLLAAACRARRLIPERCANDDSYLPRFSVREFSSSSSSPSNGANKNKTKDYTQLRRLEDANPVRIRGIQVNPDSIGSIILPGNLVYKKYKWSGNTRKVPLELVHGYFWMMWDLRNTQGKPTLSNETLIPEEDAQLFPVLLGLKTLNNVKANLPFLFVENNEVKCTLVSISFRDSGYKNIASWTEPFSKAFEGNRAIDHVKISITERWSLYLLQGVLTKVMKKNTLPEEHDKTLVYFGTDVDDFRDVLRMHNLMANYVFLVDDLGRIRFAGSGEATNEEIERVVHFAKQILAKSKRNKTKTRKNAQIK